MTKQQNAGKVFEDNFQQSVKNSPQPIFFDRIKDTFVPPDLRMRVRVSKNKYDCYLFSEGYLFPLELKSTKENRLAWNESIIKEHQIESLVEASKYSNVISGFIVNFREPENRVFFVSINKFLEYKNIAENQIKIHNYKSKVNKSSMPIGICEEIGIEIQGFKKRTNYHYHINDFIRSAIEEYKKERKS